MPQKLASGFDLVFDPEERRFGTKRARCFPPFRKNVVHAYKEIFLDAEEIISLGKWAQ